MQVRTSAEFALAPVSLKPLTALAGAWRTLVLHRLARYRPEKHYMRGPGPKCREKHAWARPSAGAGAGPGRDQGERRDLQAADGR